MTAETVPDMQDQRVGVAGRSVRFLAAGSGDAAIVLHHSIGNPGWLPFHSELARRFRTYVPDLPGWGKSERPDWARDVRDIAMLTNLFLDRLDVGDVTLVGCGFGGFVAAEMAIMNQRRIKKMVLVGAPGILPEDGVILDQMLIAHEEYVRAGFHDDQAFQRVFGDPPSAETRDLWDYSREMTARVCWKPYMHDRRLPHLLRSVWTPTLLVWGEHDRVVPRGTAQAYLDALPHAELDVVPRTGHLVDLEQPTALAQLVTARAVPVAT